MTSHLRATSPRRRASLRSSAQGSFEPGPAAPGAPKLASRLARCRRAQGVRMSLPGTFVRRHFEPLVLSVQVLIDLVVVLLACVLGWQLRDGSRGARTRARHLPRSVLADRGRHAGVLPLVRHVQPAQACSASRSSRRSPERGHVVPGRARLDGAAALFARARRAFTRSSCRSSATSTSTATCGSTRASCWCWPSSTSWC